MIAVVDAGALYAAADETDANHEASLETLERADLELVIPALVVALAERLDTDTVITFDRRHFAAIRPLHRTALRLLPE